MVLVWLLALSHRPERLASVAQEEGRLGEVWSRACEELGRTPTPREWAASAGLSVVELEARRRAAREATRELVETHQGLVRSLARKVAWTRRVDVEDLAQEGNLGLVRAIEKYDGTRAKFSTYATIWIRAAMFDLARRSRGAVVLPQRVLDIEAKAGRLLREEEDSATTAAAEIGVSETRLREARRLAQLPTELEEVAAGDADAVVAGLRRDLARAFDAHLDARETRVLRLRPSRRPSGCPRRPSA
ncbi:hypothetical protein CTAYLR_000589 [Chrysophaeum taylorii]|uniref:RNA polymerase sigma-70 region 2 domain-containing protein n=1 Tax=Chrysophaeum taylorii TaxID=2483200 RepID=A0AAD7UGV7_9STRA|nr:hypothetical protein CTAYLR_000589 [Chrysophaeum taylorii]